MKFLKWLLIVVVVLAVLFFTVGQSYMREQTKKHSPEKVATMKTGGMDLSVKYSSPSKKGRVIFGELVPYDAVWRTGANEPTVFSTTTDISVAGQKLPAGTYSLWTIPNPNQWSVILNTEVPDWGVTILSMGKKTQRDPEKDAIEIEVATEKLATPQENFIIDFETSGQAFMTLSWDDTKIKVPISN
ncbi:MAG: DUF2911 domain-containing protein [Flavobacteriaceae bacterium]